MAFNPNCIHLCKRHKCGHLMAPRRALFGFVPWTCNCVLFVDKTAECALRVKFERPLLRGIRRCSYCGNEYAAKDGHVCTDATHTFVAAPIHEPAPAPMEVQELKEQVRDLWRMFHADRVAMFRAAFPDESVQCLPTVFMFEAAGKRARKES